MGKRFLHNRAAVITVAVVLLIGLIGILAPVLAPHDPYATDILNKFAPYSMEYPLGTDHLGRCVLSRLIYGIRPTLGLALLTMLGDYRPGGGTGHHGRLFPGRGGGGHHACSGCDALLSQPDHGVCRGWPAGHQCAERHHRQRIYQMGLVRPYDPHRRHAVPGAELHPILPLRGDAGAVYPVPSSAAPPSPPIWQCLPPWMWAGPSSIFPPCPSWDWVSRPPRRSGGAMLNEAKEVLTSNPTQMVAPGIAIVALVCCFNLMGDALRDVLDPKEVDR